MVSITDHVQLKLMSMTPVPPVNSVCTFYPHECMNYLKAGTRRRRNKEQTNLGMVKKHGDVTVTIVHCGKALDTWIIMRTNMYKTLIAVRWFLNNRKYSSKEKQQQKETNNTFESTLSSFRYHTDNTCTDNFLLLTTRTIPYIIYIEANYNSCQFNYLLSVIYNSY